MFRTQIRMELHWFGFSGWMDSDPDPVAVKVTPTVLFLLLVLIQNFPQINFFVPAEVPMSYYLLRRGTYVTYYVQ